MLKSDKWTHLWVYCTVLDTGWVGDLPVQTLPIKCSSVIKAYRCRWIYTAKLNGTPKTKPQSFCLLHCQWRSQRGAKGGTCPPNLSQGDPPDLLKSDEFFSLGGVG